MKYGNLLYVLIKGILVTYKIKYKIQKARNMKWDNEISSIGVKRNNR